MFEWLVTAQHGKRIDVVAWGAFTVLCVLALVCWIVRTF